MMGIQARREAWWLAGSRLDTARQMLAEGYSYSLIGQAIGISRHAVAGKLNRLGLRAAVGVEKKVKPHKEHKPHHRYAATLDPAWILTLPPLPSFGHLRLVCAPPEVFSQPRTCQFPLWGNERPTHEYCADRAIVGRPYCSAHCAKAYVKPTHPQQVYA